FDKIDDSLGERYYLLYQRENQCIGKETESRKHHHVDQQRSDETRRVVLFEVVHQWGQQEGHRHREQQDNNRLNKLAEDIPGCPQDDTDTKNADKYITTLLPVLLIHALILCVYHFCFYILCQYCDRFFSKLQGSSSSFHFYRTALPNRTLQLRRF